MYAIRSYYGTPEEVETVDSHQRVVAVLEGREPDRVPVFPQIGDHAGIIAGLTHDVMYTDARPGF